MALLFKDSFSSNLAPSGHEISVHNPLIATFIFLLVANEGSMESPC